MNSAEEVPPDDWTPLDHLWEDLAEAWFKPGRDGPTFKFRVPRGRLESADAPLTVEALLAAASLSPDEVASWRLGDEPDSDPAGAAPGTPLPPPASDATHLTVYVRLKPAEPATVGDESAAPADPLEKQQALDALWRAILGLEANIDSIRAGAEGLRAELDASFRQPLSAEDKLHALQSDVAQWTKAKSRVHYAVPKVREFIHRATWAAAAAERKELEELLGDVTGPRVPLHRLDEVRERLEHLQKDRQVLLSQGNAVSQEGRVVLAEIQRAVGTLQRNAADRARKQREARRTKGKYL